MDIKAPKKDRQPSSNISGSPKKGGGGGKYSWGKGGLDDLKAVSVKDSKDPNYDSEEEENEEHILNPVTATVALFLVTALVAVCAEYLVDSIDSIVETTGVSKTFIGLILLPIVGNAAEHVTACVVAYKNKMDLAIGVAIGSSLQIALFVTPFLVILGWIIGEPMTLHFQIFETVVFFPECLGRELSHPGRQEQLPRGRDVYWNLHHNRPRVLRLPRRRRRHPSPRQAHRKLKTRFLPKKNLNFKKKSIYKVTSYPSVHYPPYIICTPRSTNQSINPSLYMPLLYLRRKSVYWIPCICSSGEG